MDGEFDEEPQLLCDSQHDGDVLDLQVRVNTHTHTHTNRPRKENEIFHFWTSLR